MRVQCPSCAKAVDAPDERAGQMTACPACSGQMQLPTPNAAAMPLADAPASQANGAAEVKTCPHCGEKILKVAKKCKHCGSFALGNRKPDTAAASPAVGKLSPRERLKNKGSGDGRMALVFALIGLVPICAIALNAAGLIGLIPILAVPIFIMPVFALLAVIYGLSARKYPMEKRTATAGLILGAGEFALLALTFGYGIFKGFTS